MHKAIKNAKRNGYFVCKNWHDVGTMDKWYLGCKTRGRPFVAILKHKRSATIIMALFSHALTEEQQAKLQQAINQHSTSHEVTVSYGATVTHDEVPVEVAEPLAQTILDIVTQAQ